MDVALLPNAALPEIRGDLGITEAPRDHSGERGWVIFDPLCHAYYHLDRKYLKVLGLWRLGTPQAIIDTLGDGEIALNDIETLIRFLFSHNLTVSPAGDDVGNYLTQIEARKKKSYLAKIQSIVFFRAPLIRPHNFLKRTLPLTNIFHKKAWWGFVATVLVIDIFLLLRHWDEFVHTFMYFFNFEGMFYYMLTLCFVKIGHELGHGYSATRFGCRVKSMGVALLALMPVLYTDTTDSWRISSRRKRLIIISSGVIVELMIAVFATFLWGFLPDGMCRSAAFFLATTSWIMSLAVNLNPLMRYDAYYFLSDAIAIQNLQTRSFLRGRWALREFLFHFRDPRPATESHMRDWALLLYAYAAWIYRFFLFLGIAVLLRMMLGKPVGDVLFCVEIGGFIVLPVMAEIGEWWQRLKSSRPSKRAMLTLTIMAGGLIVFLVPLSTTVRIPAVLEACQQTTVYTGNAGRIQSIHVRSGDYVDKGDLLLVLESPEITFRLDQTRRRLELVRVQLNRMVADSRDRKDRIVLKRREIRLVREIDGLNGQLASMTISAPFPGVVSFLAPDLHVGRWINQDIALGTLVSVSKIRARGYVPGEASPRIVPGARAMFIPDVPEERKREGHVKEVADTNVDIIDIPMLSSQFGGGVASSITPENTLKPLKAWYPIIISLPDEKSAPMHEIRGVVHVAGLPESMALKVWRRVATVLIRESMV